MTSDAHHDFSDHAPGRLEVIPDAVQFQPFDMHHRSGDGINSHTTPDRMYTEYGPKQFFDFACQLKGEYALHAQTPEVFRISIKIPPPQLRVYKSLRFVFQSVIPEIEIHQRPCYQSLVQSIILMSVQNNGIVAGLFDSGEQLGETFQRDDLAREEFD
jgi:hypothetical protein